VRILIAEDEPVTRLLLERTLAGWGYAVVAAADGPDALRHLMDPAGPQLAVLDWVMPGLDGADVCRAVRARETERYVYLLLLRSRGGKEDVVAGLEAGADDYLVKPLDPMELRARLNTGRRILDLQTQLIAARDTLRWQATHDALTGVWNRAAILDRLRCEVEAASHAGAPLSAVLIDLDHFKLVNDTHGHPAGDAVLRAAAARLAAGLPQGASLGRYGGEEFLVVLPGLCIGPAGAACEALRACVADGPVEWQGTAIPVSASLGVAALGGDTATEARLLQAADDALYRAKRGGRNRVEAAR
jgi:diguanylate cyclase (GGDEF)-like protein